MDDKIKGGYLLIPRVMKDWPIMRTAPINRELWWYILTNVMFKDYKELKRGQGYFRFSKIQDDLSWMVGYRKMKYSKKQLTISLRRQREMGLIETAKATQGILITVCNYDYYQDFANYEGINEGITRRQQSGINIKKEGSKEGTYKKESIRRPGEKFSFEGDEMNYSEKL